MLKGFILYAQKVRFAPMAMLALGAFFVAYNPSRRDETVKIALP
jgi:hypothetical protein